MATIEPKTLKKMRANEERCLRGHIQTLEGYLNNGKYDKARHSMADVLTCARNLQTMVNYTIGDEGDDE